IEVGTYHLHRVRWRRRYNFGEHSRRRWRRRRVRLRGPHPLQHRDHDRDDFARWSAPRQEMRHPAQTQGHHGHAPRGHLALRPGRPGGADACANCDAPADGAARPSGPGHPAGGPGGRLERRRRSGSRRGAGGAACVRRAARGARGARAAAGRAGGPASPGAAEPHGQASGGPQAGVPL
ncbi:unnamed protein product, partial [Prorocentrum cordatum]